MTSAIRCRGKRVRERLVSQVRIRATLIEKLDWLGIQVAMVHVASRHKASVARCKATSGVGGKADLPVERPDFSL